MKGLLIYVQQFVANSIRRVSINTYGIVHTYHANVCTFT